MADCSVMPRIIRGNTHAPTVMIGERCADFILRGDGAGARAGGQATAAPAVPVAS